MMSTTAQVQVFGCDDLWRHIKSFIFSPKKCWAETSYKMGPCKGCLKIAYTSKHECVQARGDIHRFTTVWYTCQGHSINDPFQSHSAC